jgi:hypothetical protein
MDGIIENSHWLPITEYAQRRGISISTLRRKIKASELEFKMEDGRYLIRCDGEEALTNSEPHSFVSTDVSRLTRADVEAMIASANAANALQWRAIEARVAGLSKKLEMFSEQIAELNMLVKIFEEKLDEQQ